MRAMVAQWGLSLSAGAVRTSVTALNSLSLREVGRVLYSRYRSCVTRDERGAVNLRTA